MRKRTERVTLSRIHPLVGEEGNSQPSPSRYKRLICGVDEAGRGPLAGPVVAAAILLPDDFDLNGIDDSKAMSPTQREKQRMRIMQSGCQWGVGVVGPDLVDDLNIHYASFLAMKWAIDQLGIIPDVILVDGRFRIPDLPINQKAIVGGDRLEPVIGAASILAKTFRDDLMLQYSRIYPEYGFEKHKGYATVEHIANLMSHGPCAIHRKTYYPVSSFFNGQDAVGVQYIEPLQKYAGYMNPPA
jgi:ribonuclease HII